jgi:hypothetical protein
MLLLNLGLALRAAHYQSPTFDEPAHLAAGVTNLTKADFRLLPQSPPLPHLLAAAPVVAAGVTLPPSDLVEWRESDGYRYSVLLLHGQTDPPQVVIGRARWAMALLMPLLGLLVWWWSSKLWGLTAGLVSLGVFTCSPTVLAHGPLVAADFVAALGFLLVVTTWWLQLHRLTLGTVLASAGSLALLALSKFSVVLALPMLAALVAAAAFRRRSLTLLLPGRPAIVLHKSAHRMAAWSVAAIVQAALVIILIWGCYGMRFSMPAPAEASTALYPTVSAGLPPAEAWDYLLTRTGWKGSAIRMLRDAHLLPEAWLYGLTYTFDATRNHPAYFLGEHRADGWWYFLPVIFLMKTPLPILALLALAAWPRKRPPAAADAPPPATDRGIWTTTPLWVLLTVYMLPAMAAGLSIGHRHLLPVLPVLYIFAGRAAAAGDVRSLRSRTTAAVALTVLAALATLSIHPHYLSFFNTAAGGPAQAYRHVVDSSLDWGQDLPALRAKLDEMGFPPDLTDTPAMPSAVYLAYFGTALPPFYGIEARQLPGTFDWAPPERRPLTPGVYCISATLLQQITPLRVTAWTAATEAVYQDLVGVVTRTPGQMSDGDWMLFGELRFARLCVVLRQREPDDRAGYSILIYRVDIHELARGIGGLPPESAPESDRRLLALAERSYMLRGPRTAAGFFEHYLARTVGASTPERRAAIVKCANALMGIGRQARAIELLHDAVAAEPGDVDMHHTLAWLLATSPDEALRDGAAAVRHARLADQLSGGEDAAVLDVLAAALAENGEFALARETAGRALAAATAMGDREQAAAIAERLRLYEAGRPYREP